MQIERTLPDAEDVRALTAQRLADNAAAVPGAAHDLLDGAPFIGQSKNDAIDLFSSCKLRASTAALDDSSCRHRGARTMVSRAGPGASRSSFLAAMVPCPSHDTQRGVRANARPSTGDRRALRPYKKAIRELNPAPSECRGSPTLLARHRAIAMDQGGSQPLSPQCDSIWLEVYI
jgi:hypothetical protein